MKTFRFTLHIETPHFTWTPNHPQMEFDDFANKLYPKFSDGTFGIRCGQGYIAIDREAESFMFAIASALGDAASLGLKVTEIVMTPDDYKENFNGS